MIPPDLDHALRAETDRVEWKQGASDATEIYRAVCALANDLAGAGTPGLLLLGVANDGRVVGVDGSDAALRKLTDRIKSTRILPAPSVDVRAVDLGGATIVVVRVEAFRVPPVVKFDGVAWVRVGATTRRATEADLSRLQERRPESAMAFDSRSCPGSSLDDLDLAHLRSVHASERDGDRDAATFPDFETWLCQRNLVRKGGGSWTPTHLAVLAHGLDPQRHVPGAFVEFARYDGSDFDCPISSRKSIRGRLSDQLDALWIQLQAHLVDVPRGDDGIRSPFAPEYPIDALRELARNMIQHRLYEGTNAPGRVSWLADCVVFSNPGGPFGIASEGEFGEHSDYRNPGITQHLVETGYVERLGRGVRLARSVLARNGNPPLEVETDGFTTVIVRARA